LPERFRRPLVFVAAAIVVLTLLGMIAIPYFINRQISENRELVNDELNPMEFALADAQDSLLDVGLTAPQGDAESDFGIYSVSREEFIGSLEEALSHADALEGDDPELVREAHRLGTAYVEEIADPVNELTIAGDEDGAAAIQDRAVDPFFAADGGIEDAQAATRRQIGETLNDNAALEDASTISAAILGALGIISAAIVVALTLAIQRTGRQEAQHRALVEIEKSRLDTVIDSIADGVALFDANGLPTRVNRAGVELWGISEDEITNLRAAEVTHPNTLIDESGATMGIDDLPSSVAMRENRRVTDMLFTLKRASGEEVEILSSAAPLHDFDGKVSGAVVVWHDVTDLRSVERLKDEFLSFAAHELRTPLTIVKGYASVLGRDNSNPANREMALAISEESDRIATLINQLLDISRIEAGSLQLDVSPVTVAEVVDQVVARHRDVDPEREITIDFDSPDTRCIADPEALTQILDNLLTNARKYSNPGSPVRVHFQRDGGVVRLSVIDHGIGIPPDEIERLGEKLFRASNSKGHDGSGLGIYIARKYLELQEGELRITSEVGKGSTFSVELPCDEPVAPPAQPAESEPVEA
jgi:PAS domain S-box-containing protein